MAPAADRGDGSALLRAVEVMDRLRSPGGCPWDAAQTHETLARYLLEETYETLEAIETDDPALLREELGDLLLQVLFHARLAEDRPDGQRFSIEDVAADLVAKLVRRHPHVFETEAGASGDGEQLSPSDVLESWETLKAREKKRGSLTDGIPTAQPALAYAAALVERTERNGLAVELPPGDGAVGEQLFALVRAAVADGLDPETELRRTARAYRDAIQADGGDGMTSDVTRAHPPRAGDERASMIGFLDYQRETIAIKCADLSPDELARRSVPDSALTLLGLVRHLAEVERGWFQQRVAGLDVPDLYATDADQDGDFHLPDPVSQAVVDEAFATWRREVARSDEILAGVTSLDEVFPHGRHGELSIRWLLLHMIEEYARHNGHADLLREAIDGVTGE